MSQQPDVYKLFSGYNLVTVSGLDNALHLVLQLTSLTIICHYTGHMHLLAAAVQCRVIYFPATARLRLSHSSPRQPSFRGALLAQQTSLLELYLHHHFLLLRL